MPAAWVQVTVPTQWPCPQAWSHLVPQNPAAQPVQLTVPPLPCSQVGVPVQLPC